MSLDYSAHVPEEAIEAGCLAMNDGVATSRHRARWDGEVTTVLSAAAPHLVAAELERIATYYMPKSTVRPEDCMVTEEALEAAEDEGARSMCGCLMFVASQMRQRGAVFPDRGEAQQ